MMTDVPEKDEVLLQGLAVANLNKAPSVRLAYEEGEEKDYNLEIAAGDAINYGADLEAILGKTKEGKWGMLCDNLYVVRGVDAIKLLAEAGVTNIPGADLLGIKLKPSFKERT